MSSRIITISREFGSGGRKAAALGVNACVEKIARSFDKKFCES